MSLSSFYQEKLLITTFSCIMILEKFDFYYNFDFDLFIFELNFVIYNVINVHDSINN